MDEEPKKAPQEWIEALERSEADLAAGRTVSGEAVMQRLRESIAEMRAKKKDGRVARKATNRR